MIVKPTDEDFAAGATEIALRQTGKIAAEGSKGVGAGIADLRNMYLKVVGAIMLLAFTSGAGMAMNPLFGFVATFGLLGYFGWRLFGRQQETIDLGGLAAPAAAVALAASGHQAEIETGAYDLDIAKLVQRGVVLGLPGLVLTVAGIRNDTLLSLGMVLMVLGVMLAGRAFMNRRVLIWDRYGVTSSGMLGDKHLGWHEVVQISIERAPIDDFAALFTSGARRNLVLTGVGDIINGVAKNRLLVPIELMALTPEQKQDMLLRLMACHARCGSHSRIAALLAEAELDPASPVQPLPDFGQTPRSRRHAAPPAYTPEPHLQAKGFNPDAIMARYLAEREEVVAQTRPDFTPSMGTKPSRSAGFGRKGL